MCTKTKDSCSLARNQFTSEIEVCISMTAFFEPDLWPIDPSLAGPNHRFALKHSPVQFEKDFEPLLAEMLG